jgi:hypothetical protein
MCNISKEPSTVGKYVFVSTFITALPQARGLRLKINMDWWSGSTLLCCSINGSRDTIIFLAMVRRASNQIHGLIDG